MNLLNILYVYYMLKNKYLIAHLRYNILIKYFRSEIPDVTRLPTNIKRGGLLRR